MLKLEKFSKLKIFLIVYVENKANLGGKMIVVCPPRVILIEINLWAYDYLVVQHSDVIMQITLDENRIHTR